MSPQPVSPEFSIRKVTVMEDRAQVSRSARITLPAGTSLVRADRVSPLIADRTLRATLSGAAGRVLDTRVHRRATLGATRPDREQPLAAERQELLDRILLADGELATVRSQQERLRTSLTKVLGLIARESGRGQDQKAQWEQMLHRSQAALARAVEDEAVGQKRLDDLRERLALVEERLAEARQPTSYYWGTLEAVVEVPQPGEYLLTWEYLVPCAVWRPVYHAELTEEITWSCLATVWQNTGEDWRQIQLVLSTARPAAGAEAPLLREDRLTLRDKKPEERKTVEVECRDEAIEVTSASTPGARATRVPGVDDGGQVRTFVVPTPVNIPSDGQPYQVEYARFQAQCRTDMICLPEIAELVHLRSRLANPGPLPLLAGPVHLVRQGCYVGRTQVPLIAPGESFDLGWGSEDDLAVVRKTGSQSREATLLRKAVHEYWCRLYLSNTGAVRRTIRLCERIPVSEIEDVQVKLLQEETSPGFQRDDNGRLTWEFALEPGAHQEIRLSYEVETSGRVRWSGL